MIAGCFTAEKKSWQSSKLALMMRGFLSSAIACEVGKFPSGQSLTRRDRWLARLQYPRTAQGELIEITYNPYR